MCAPPTGSPPSRIVHHRAINDASAVMPGRPSIPVLSLSGRSLRSRKCVGVSRCCQCIPDIMTVAHRSISQVHSGLGSGWTLVSKTTSVRDWNCGLRQCIWRCNLPNHAPTTDSQDWLPVGRQNRRLHHTRMSQRVMSHDAHSAAAHQAGYLQRCCRFYWI